MINLVPFDMACYEVKRTGVWNSPDDMMDDSIYDASLEVLAVMRSKMSLARLLRMAEDLWELPLSCS